MSAMFSDTSISETDGRNRVLCILLENDLPSHVRQSRLIQPDKFSPTIRIGI